MSIFSKLLHDPEKLFRVLVLFTIIPFIIALNSDLVTPVSWALIISLFLLQYQPVKNAITKWKGLDPVIKVASSVMIFGFIYVPSFIWIGLEMKLNIIWVSLLALVVYFSANSRLLSKLEEFPYKPILRSDVDDSNLNRDHGLIVILFVNGTFLTISIMLIESFITSNGRDMITVGSLRWLAFFGLLMLHAIIYSLFLQEIEWEPSSGYTRFESDITPSLPDNIQAKTLVKYFDKAGKVPPTDKFFRFIDDNLVELVQGFRNLEYTSALHALVRAYSYWGERAANKLHYLNLLIMASLSRFKVLGLIPIYNRHAIYSYLELLYKLKLLPPEWLEILQYEIKETKDMYHQLDWIAGISYNQEIHGELEWISFWNLRIFKGKEGYETIENHVVNDPYQHGETEIWIQDIWDTTFTYLQLFLGPKGRSAFEGEFSLDDALNYFASKKSLTEFQTAKNESKKALADPENRMVNVEKQRDEMTSIKQYQAFLHEESYTDYEGGDSEMDYILKRLKKNMKKIPVILFKWSLLILLAIVNIFVLYLVQQFLGEDLMTLCVALEIPLLFLFSVSTKLGGLMEENRAQNDAKISPDRQFGEKSLVSGLSDGVAEKLAFGFLIAFGYYWFLT